MSEIIAYYLERNKEHCRNIPILKMFICPVENRRPRVKYLKTLLASTLEKIAEAAGTEFYKGSIARDIADFMKKQGGFLTYDDMSRHHSEWVEPVSTTYRGYEVWELPPNGQGIAALQILNILEGYNISAMGFGSASYIHHFTEAKKLAFEDRSKYYADPIFREIPVDHLISKKYAAERRKLINPERASKVFDAGLKESGNTIYLTVADRYGNMVSLYKAITEVWDRVCARQVWVLFFRTEVKCSVLKKVIPMYAPGKRPFHTIIPAFITRNGKPWISFELWEEICSLRGMCRLSNLIDFK